MALATDRQLPDELHQANGATYAADAARATKYLNTEQTLASSPLLKDSRTNSLRFRNEKFRNSTSSFRLSKDLTDIRWDGPELKEDDVIFNNENGYASNDDDGANDSEADNEDSGAGNSLSKQEADAAQYSTISKRADFILANAKKRLNLLEGNLGKARHSLVSPQAIAELRTQSSLSSYTSTDEEERSTSVRIRPRINFAPSRRGRGPVPIRRTSSGHSRMYSDTSVPSPTGSSIKGSRSLDYMNNTEKIPSPLHEGGEFEELDQPVEDVAEPVAGPEVSPKRQSIHAIREFYGAASPAPKSTQELRDQADELRDRIAFLQKRSQAGASNGENVIKDPTAARNEQVFLEQVNALQRSLEDQERVIQQLETAERDNAERSEELENDPRGEWHQVLSRNEDRDEDGSEFSEDEYDEYDDDDLPDALADEDVDDTKSMFGAHEDREDAFDYEHFILHSGMVLPAASGPGSQSSNLSTRSASTERGMADGATAREQAFPGTVESWEAFQQPNDSIASLTTMQSFETAAEMNDSSSDVGSDTSDVQHEQLLQTGHLQDPWPMPPAVNGDGQRSAQRESQIPTPTGPSFLTPGFGAGYQQDNSTRPISNIMLSLMRHERQESEIRPLDQRDDKLVRAVAESFRGVCQQLTLAETRPREMQALRERLEVAKRILNGEL